MSGECVLVIDDEDTSRFVLTERFRDAGYAVVGAGSGREALSVLRTTDVAVCVLDYRLPDTSGLDLLERIKSEHPATPVVMITAYSSVPTAVEAMKRGAADYAVKPLDVPRLLQTVENMVRSARDDAADYQPRDPLTSLVGSSATIGTLKNLIRKLAASPISTVLLTGESGTGKDLAARCLHMASSRSERPFINITCSALPDALLESELFGHESGAFTSATKQKKGLLELADGGTVFLDEIGEMAPGLQSKLLRFLEERAFRRVGGTRDIHVDVRVVAATNRDLHRAVEAKEFRADLFYRLRVIVVRLPSLRERREDIFALAQHFIDEFNPVLGKSIIGLTPEASECLATADWPGNVRELKHVIEQAVLLCERDHIGMEALDPGVADSGSSTFRLPPQGLVLENLERSLVQQALDVTGWNRVRAAKLLGLNRDQIRYRIEKFGLCRRPD